MTLTRLPSRLAGSGQRENYLGLGSLWVTAVVLALTLIGAGPTAQAQSYNTLHSFTATIDGQYPEAALIEGSDGSFYGTTTVGGASGAGTAFKMDRSGKVTVLHSFGATLTDGQYPFAALIQGSDGSFYGTTAEGGANGFGTAFEMDSTGKVTVLYSFGESSTDGENPDAALIEGSDGSFYGTTTIGGANGVGTAFKMDRSGKVTVLHSFGATIADGQYPLSALIEGSDGSFYSTTETGGSTGGGTAFKMDRSGNVTVLYTFGITHPAPWSPRAALIEGSDGFFYGTTAFGGVNSVGTIFKMDLSGKVTVLYSFSEAGTVGQNPYLIQGLDGSFYGTSNLGGANGSGIMFKMDISGNVTVLHSFGATSTDGQNPYAALTQGSDGSLYGTTKQGGANGAGTVFSLDFGPGTPILTSLSPSTANSEGPAFTLILKGSAFASYATVQWTSGSVTTPLTTTFVASTQLKATVPSSLIANAGKAILTVANASGSVSKGKPFTIVLTTLKLLSANVTKTSAGSYSVKIALKNSGYASASAVKITQSSLGTAATSTPLPVSLGSLAKGATGATSLSFVGSAGSSGTLVTLKVSGTFTGGTFNGSLKVTLP